MKKNQWFAFGIGFLILGFLMFVFMTGLIKCSSYIGDMLTSCMNKRYLYATPGIVCMFLGLIFTICGGMLKE